LAEELGGVIDNTSCVCHGPGIEASQEVGIVEGTLGQARQRADLIIYWGCNPLQAHIRHLTRYTVMSSGLFRAGRKDRKLVVVDVRKTTTAKLADMFIQIEPGMDYELIQALRMAVRDEEIEMEKVAGIPVEQVEELADLMVSCEFGFIFFGLGLTQSSAKNENIAAAISLIRDLNLKTKWLILPMRGHHNVTGANKVTLWETGYPFAVDFSHGYPRYNPGETSAVDLLTRCEVDAALIVASDPVAHMPAQTAKAFTEIPVVVVDPLMTASSLLADVRIPAAFVGVESEGTIYRMDGVPLRAKKLVEPPEDILPDKVLLTRLLERIRKLRGR
ncbi:TPA: formylmethanofuran dehydrogenase subunit B, partial [Candidatus Bathyarchaeota archaeon]|nr:formylmethanofuran dehydrogenase subunit B [Candidatus Bathyarchaeota archaeon]